jgi:hypothetical protein
MGILRLDKDGKEINLILENERLRSLLIKSADFVEGAECQCEISEFQCLRCEIIQETVREVGQ